MFDETDLKTEPVLKAQTFEWNGILYPVPDIELIKEWLDEGGCETPDGDWVEPDATDSWALLLGYI